MRPFDLVIFDCDGVLVDSERLSHGVLVAMLAELGLVLTVDEAVAHFIGSSMPQCLATITRLLGRTPPADFLPQFGQRTRAAFTAALQPVAGAAELLAALSTAGINFCVASNGNRAKMDFTLGHTGLLPLLAGRLYCADDVARPKPAPDLFLHAARQAGGGVAPARCVVIEDTPTGISAALAAGMQAFGFAAMTPAHRLRAAGAHRVFDRLAELPAWLGLPAPTAGLR